MDQDGSGHHLELDLEHYIIPAPSASGTGYMANRAENPKSLFQIGNQWKSEVPMFSSDNSNSAINSNSYTIDIDNHIKVVQTLRQVIFVLLARAVLSNCLSISSSDLL